jgi:hypothetical protein
MMAGDELFPFPPQDVPESNPEKNAEKNAVPSLPPFPVLEAADLAPASAAKKPVLGPGTREQLTAEEIEEIRTFLGLFGPAWLKRVDKEDLRSGKLPGGHAAGQPVPSPTPPISPVPPATIAPIIPPAGPLSAAEPEISPVSLWEGIHGQPGFEQEWHGECLALLRDIQDRTMGFRVFCALAGVFPWRECLRHATPDQKLFATVALGDRFLQGLSGMTFSQRKPLIKAVARYLSGLTEVFSFIQAEGEPFNNQYQERVEGSSSGGRVVREMRGFLVVRKDSSQVVRLGRVFT